MLPYLPAAVCRDDSDGAICETTEDKILIVTFSSKLEGGATSLLSMSVENLKSVLNSLESPQPIARHEAVSDFPAIPQPCSILTADDVQTALGRPIRGSRHNSDNDCLYESKPGESAMIQLFDDGIERLNHDRTQMRGTVNITGVGDDAFAFVSVAGFVQISFVKGSQYAVLVFSQQGNPNLLETGKELAKKVAARMP